MDAYINATNHRSPVLVSAEAAFSACPFSSGAGALCANLPPPINITRAATIYPDTDVIIFDTTDPTAAPTHLDLVIFEEISAIISNLIRTFHAAVRIDLGNPSPNNVFLNPSVLNATFSEQFPATSILNSSRSLLYLANIHPEWFTANGRPPLPMEGIAYVRVVYLCRFQRGKPLRQAFVSVLVATLSMFSSGWAIFMLLATYFAKRSNVEGQQY
jgi:hypothetical protein